MSFSGKSPWKKIWNEFFSGKSSWNAVFPFSEYKEHCEMECEMHLWNEIIKNECVDFSWRFISFHKHDFVKRYELVCEKIWNESWKAEFNSFSSQIEVYSNVCFRFLVLWPLDLIITAYDDRNCSDFFKPKINQKQNDPICLILLATKMFSLLECHFLNVCL